MKFKNTHLTLTVALFIFACGRDTPHGISKEAFEPETIFLTWQQNPTTTMTIDWHTTDRGRATVLEYREVNSQRWRQVEGDMHEFPFSERQIHRVELTGLQPGTTYRFRLDTESPAYSFRTMPADASEPITFVTGGDVRSGSIPAEPFIRMSRIAAEYEPDFIAIGGDFTYVDGVPHLKERWYEFFDVLKEEFTRENNLLIPVITVIGNHEQWSESRLLEDMPLDYYRNKYDLQEGESPYFDNVFAFPVDPYYGVLDFGDYMSWILLDSGHMTDIDGKQTRWLNHTLSERSDRPHLFPMYHVPGWPSVRDWQGGSSTRIRNNWVPLFEQYGVRTVFENHDHAYKRTYPLRNGEISPDDGIVYIGDGAWGVSPRPLASRNQNADIQDYWYIEKASTQRHVIVGTIHEEEQHFLSVNEYGQVIDEYPGEEALADTPSDVLAINPATYDPGEATYLVQPVHQDDSLSLVALYHSTNGDNWDNNTGWLKGPVATWFGRIRIRSDGRIDQFYLYDNNLSGTLPKEIADMESLFRFRLGNNNLEGEIPAWLGSMERMQQLDLSGNNFSGNIPGELGHLTQLEWLDLSDNQLDGHIPDELKNLRFAEWIDLSDNSLSGPIPAVMGEMDHRLQELDLSGNQLTGEIPSKLVGARFLQKLDLSDNVLSGPIPASLGKLNYLRELNLSGNRFSGSIPEDLSNLISLERLHLDGNDFTGPIPQRLQEIME